VSLAVWAIDQMQPPVVLTGSTEVLYFLQTWLPDGRLLYTRLDWDEGSMTGEHTLWTITYVNDVAGAPQPAVDIPPAYDRTALLERLPSEFQNAGSFSWSPDNQWVTFHAGDWPDIAVYLWHWEDGAAPYRLLQGTSPQWQPTPQPTPSPAPLASPTETTPETATFTPIAGDVAYVRQGSLSVLLATTGSRTPSECPSPRKPPRRF